jgi:formate--tetrahydrofolate ligase
VKPIVEIAAELGIQASQLIPYGHDKAKVLPGAYAAESNERGKLVLVTAVSPTPAGEGKTTTSIGLGDGLRLRGEKVCLALREPSLGPCFGIKGGGTGGGESRLHPSDDINLHFTGDFHAITSAHNLLSAVIDNQLQFGLHPGLDGRRLRWKRVLDVNDRSLRQVITGLGGPLMGEPVQSGFDITAASELMAILCLASDADDLRKRIDRILIGTTPDRQPILAESMRVTGAMLALLRDALHPNLVQSQHGTPALVHGGPFANIAHGCNSVIATKAALQLADWCVTEAGFGCDLGAEKFFDIKCRMAGLDPALVVLVASIRALKYHGGAKLDALTKPDPARVEAGLPNLAKHAENVRQFGKPAVVAINRFGADTDEEIAVVREFCRSKGLRLALCEHFGKGPEGAVELAEQVIEAAKDTAPGFTPMYELADPLPEKIRKIATKVYGADDVVFAGAAERTLETIERFGYGDLPVCMAKTQASLSDDPNKIGRPQGFTINVRDIEIAAGAGFVVALTGEMMRMPGLPKKPQAEAIDLQDGQIVNLR